MDKINNKKILFAGGGTGGSVTPLLAVAEELISNFQFQTTNFFWLGTKTGIEKQMVKKLQMPFKAIAGGKLRRYWSWRNFSDLILIAAGFFQSLLIMRKWKPDLVMCAGSFVGVPVVWAAWILWVPALIHQQDARPGLANKLMAPFARVITVTFEKSLKNYGKKTVWTGNPVRQSLTDSSKSRLAGADGRFNLNEDLPVVLILGGGTGALAINNLVKDSIDELKKYCQIIHLTGKGKSPNFQFPITNYKNFEFLDALAMANAYRSADVVVSRCGMSVLTELAYLGKPAILIPIPNSHQQENAAVFAKAEAAIVLDQKQLTARNFTEKIKLLLDNTMLSGKLSGNIRSVMKADANQEIVKVIEKLLI